MKPETLGLKSIVSNLFANIKKIEIIAHRINILMASNEWIANCTYFHHQWTVSVDQLLKLPFNTKLACFL